MNPKQLRRGGALYVIRLLAIATCGAVFLACAPALAAFGDIETFAGSGTPGNGDGGTAMLANLEYPYGVALDGSGNLYFASNNSHAVRKVDINGVITTVAGGNDSGYSGNGGLATGAQLWEPRGVALDSAGNLYIADSANNAIRKVDTSGIITTVAGGNGAGSGGNDGPATAAKLYYPHAITLDNAGNLYIADTLNNAIRKVDTGGIITKIAGNGAGYAGDGGAATAAKFTGPAGLAFDDAGGALYIGDEFNHAIRKIDAAGVITTVAGGHGPGYSGDGGAATAASLRSSCGVAFAGGVLYVADSGNHALRKVDAAGVITTIAGGTGEGYSGDGGLAGAAKLYTPRLLSLDSVGNLYIADMDNNAIRTIEASGVITTVAGGIGWMYSGDGGAATAAKLFNPGGMAFDAAGNLYVADIQNNAIRMIDTSGTITTVAGGNGPGYSGDGGSATAAQLYSPMGVAFDSAGSGLYIADANNNAVRKVDAGGVITTVAGGNGPGYSGNGGLATAAMLRNPCALAFDSTDCLLIADTDNNVIRKVDVSGNISTFAGIVTAGYSGDGGAATSASISGPYGIAVRADNVYIADTYNHAIRMIDAGGAITTIAGGNGEGYAGDGAAATAAQLNSPFGVAFDGDGNLFIGDIGNQAIRNVNMSGDIATVAGGNGEGFSGDGGPATAAQFAFPYGVALDAAGSLYIADTYNNCVRIAEVLAITTTTLPAGHEGAAYAMPALTASGGTQPYTWSMTGGVLPAGLTFNAAAALIEGTPVAGTGGNPYTVSLRVEDADGDNDNADFIFLIELPAAPLAISPAVLPGGREGATYTMSPFAATGGTLPYTWSIVGGVLPAGLTFNALIARIEGTPLPGSGGTPYSVTLHVVDAAGDTDDATFTFAIDPALAVMTIAPATLPAGREGAAYTMSPLTASGGTQPYIWSMTGGALPAGLTFNAAAAIIEGTPLSGAAGTSYTVTLHVEDADGNADEESFTLTIDPRHAGPVTAPGGGLCTLSAGAHGGPVWIIGFSVLLLTLGMAVSARRRKQTACF